MKSLVRSGGSEKIPDTRERIGTKTIEDAVCRALRWLKTVQAKDGFWADGDVETSALALLAFLEHGETFNADGSPEFSQTLRRGFDALLCASSWTTADDESLPLVATTLLQGHAYTRSLSLYEAGRQAALRLCDPQLRERFYGDPIRAAWSVRALKLAYLGVTNQSDRAIFSSTLGTVAVSVKRNSAEPKSSFFAEHPAASLLTLQMLGEARAPETNLLFQRIDGATCSFTDYAIQPWGHEREPVQGWFFLSSAFFHNGGSRWMRWNKLAFPELMAHQQISGSVYTNTANGKVLSLGWWDTPSPDEFPECSPAARRIRATALCSIQFTLYYAWKAWYFMPVSNVSDPSNSEDDIVIHIP